jgi:hypothetical protein
MEAGSRPVAEVKAFGVSPPPIRRATFVSAKVAKTIDAPSGLVGGKGRQPEERTNSQGSNRVR